MNIVMNTVRLNRMDKFKHWMREFLQSLKKRSVEVILAGQSQGYSYSELRLAKINPGVKSITFTQRKSGPWYWYLPNHQPGNYNEIIKHVDCSHCTHLPNSTENVVKHCIFVPNIFNNNKIYGTSGRDVAVHIIGCARDKPLLTQSKTFPTGKAIVLVGRMELNPQRTVIKPGKKPMTGELTPKLT